MKRTHLLRTTVAAFGFATVLLPSPVLAIAFTVHADVGMNNIRWEVGAGSSLDWITDWELLASASCFDSVNGFAGDFQMAFGQPASVAVGADSGYSQASAQAVIDGTGIPGGLQASLDLTFAPGVTFASGFSTAMAYREFMISGGSGAVEATFSYDYLAHLIGDAPGWGADYRALLSISDGTTSYDLAAYDLLMDPMNATFGESLSQTFGLQYDTPYSITLSVDPDPHVPESGPGVLLTAVVLLFMGVFGSSGGKARLT